MAKPRFQELASRTIPNFFTEERFHLVPADARFQLGPEPCAQAAAVCNEPLVYDTLFAPRLQGKPYSHDDARRFLRWAQQGWEEDTHYVFLILHPDRSIVGAVDIKSSNLKSAEVGYWMSARHPGVMTNALTELTRIAREAGYQQLYARVREENVKSAGVLRRAGFECTESFVADGRSYRRFTLAL